MRVDIKGDLNKKIQSSTIRWGVVISVVIVLSVYAYNKLYVQQPVSEKQGDDNISTTLQQRDNNANTVYNAPVTNIYGDTTKKTPSEPVNTKTKPSKEIEINGAEFNGPTQIGNDNIMNN